jgi:hypothetical protein
VDFTLSRLREGDTVEETIESHTVRYFFPQEISLFLEVSGFQLLRLGAFPEFDRDPDQSSWNVMGVAMAA